MPQISDFGTSASGTSTSPVASANAKKPAQSLTFSDLLDTINPLQHIPIIGTIYRAITGDKISPTAEIAGGALFGGIIGAMGSLADVVFTQATGKDFGATVLSWLGFDKNAAGTTQFANADNSGSSSAPSSNTSVTPVDLAVTRANVAYRRAISLQHALPARASLRY